MANGVRIALFLNATKQFDHPTHRPFQLMGKTLQLSFDCTTFRNILDGSDDTDNFPVRLLDRCFMKHNVPCFALGNDDLRRVNLTAAALQ